MNNDFSKRDSEERPPPTLLDQAALEHSAVAGWGLDSGEFNAIDGTAAGSIDSSVDEPTSNEMLDTMAGLMPEGELPAAPNVPVMCGDCGRPITVGQPHYSWGEGFVCYACAELMRSAEAGYVGSGFAADAKAVEVEDPSAPRKPRPWRTILALAAVVLLLPSVVALIIYFAVVDRAATARAQADAERQSAGREYDRLIATASARASATDVANALERLSEARAVLESHPDLQAAVDGEQLALMQQDYQKRLETQKRFQAEAERAAAIVAGNMAKQSAAAPPPGWATGSASPGEPAAAPTAPPFSAPAANATTPSAQPADPSSAMASAAPRPAPEFNTQPAPQPSSTETPGAIQGETQGATQGETQGGTQSPTPNPAPASASPTPAPTPTPAPLPPDAMPAPSDPKPTPEPPSQSQIDPPPVPVAPAPRPDPVTADDFADAGSQSLIEGNTKAAATYYAEALRLKPGHERAAMGRILISYLRGNIQTATDAMEAINAVHSTRTSVQNLAAMHQAHNVMRSARVLYEYLRKADEIDSDAFDYYVFAMWHAQFAVDKKSAAYWKIADFYDIYEQQLRLAHNGVNNGPNVRRWGKEWVSAEDYRAKLDKLRAARNLVTYTDDVMHSRMQGNDLYNQQLQAAQFKTGAIVNRATVMSALDPATRVKLAEQISAARFQLYESLRGLDAAAPPMPTNIPLIAP